MPFGSVIHMYICKDKTNNPNRQLVVSQTEKLKMLSNRKKRRNMKKPENFSHVCCVALGKQPMKSELDIRKIPTNKVSTHFCFLPSTSGYVLYCVIFWCVCKCDSTFIYNSNTIWTKYNNNNNNILCEIIFFESISIFFFVSFYLFCLFSGYFHWGLIYSEFASISSHNNSKHTTTTKRKTWTSYHNGI